MVLVQSCIDNIGLMKKAAFLFISLVLVFPLGFWRGKTQQTVGLNRKAVQRREQAPGRLSLAAAAGGKQRAGSNAPLVGRELPLL